MILEPLTLVLPSNADTSTLVLIRLLLAAAVLILLVVLILLITLVVLLALIVLILEIFGCPFLKVPAIAVTGILARTSAIPAESAILL